MPGDRADLWVAILSLRDFFPSITFTPSPPFNAVYPISLFAQYFWKTTRGKGFESLRDYVEVIRPDTQKGEGGGGGLQPPTAEDSNNHESPEGDRRFVSI